MKCQWCSKTVARGTFCDRKCMALSMVKPRCTNPTHSRWKAHLKVGKQCEGCGRGGRLHVHHRDLDPLNNAHWNLRTLCPSCHGRSHSPNFKEDGKTRRTCAHCTKPSVKVGLCFCHLSRLRRHGHPLAKMVRSGSGWRLDLTGLPA